MKTKIENYVTGAALALMLAVVIFFAANPLMFKYLLAMIGGSIQAGHL